MEWLPDDCVICTRKGKGICALSGGDYDGDIIAVLQDPWLVDFFRATSTGLTHTAGAARVEVKAELQALAVINVAQQGVVDPGAYRAYVANLPTPEIRGTTTAMFERVLHVVLEVMGPSSSMKDVFAMAEIVYAAYDAPKKYSHQP
jgi:hypothetical protein